MKKSISQMSNLELRQYLSENRHDEERFSQALELLMSRKNNNFKYPPPSEMDPEEIETLLKAKFNQHNQSLSGSLHREGMKAATLEEMEAAIEEGASDWT